MKLNELLALSFSSLRSNKLRTGLTTLGIIIGVFAVILLVSIGSGLQTYITDQVSGLGSNLIFVIPGTTGGGRTAGGQQTNKLTFVEGKLLETKLKGLAEVGPIVQKSATTKYESKSDKGTSVLGTTANYPKIVKTNLVKGSYFTDAQERSGAKVAIIGQTVWDKLFNLQDVTGKQISVAGTRYTIIGILKKKGQFLV
ncbi:hypothetical protein BH09PAT1_BH09PAT1_2530 [soil metagenome]